MSKKDQPEDLVAYDFYVACYLYDLQRPVPLGPTAETPSDARKLFRRLWILLTRQLLAILTSFSLLSASLAHDLIGDTVHLALAKSAIDYAFD